MEADVKQIIDHDETWVRIHDREAAHLAATVESVVSSVSPYSGVSHGEYVSASYPSGYAVDVEFPSYLQACEWARDKGMVEDVVVSNPKLSLSSPCTLTFSLQSFVLAAASR